MNKAISQAMRRFGATYWSILGHPYALARTALLDAISSCHPSLIHGKTLDVGCGAMPYRHLFINCEEYHGLEIDQPRNRNNPNVTYWYDGTTFPVPSQEYSALLCSQVLEHSFKPDLLLSEIYRVLKPGGQVIITVPFIWPEHEQPHDSQRFTSFGLLKRLNDIGFKEITCIKTNPGLSTFAQLAIEWAEGVSRSLSLSGSKAKLWRLFMFLPYSILNSIGIAYRSIPVVMANSSKAEIYLDLVVSAHKP